MVLVLGSSYAQTIADFQLPSTDGSTVQLKRYSGAKAVVLVFQSNHCVYCRGYEDRLIRLAQGYGNQGFSFVLVNSNNPAQNPEESLQRMRERASEKGYPFAYVQDAGQQIATQLGVQRNPEAVVLIPSGAGFTVMYRGRIDDNPITAERVNDASLENVLKHILAGQTSPIAGLQGVGCAIK
jgi:peroxiredoxin